MAGPSGHASDYSPAGARAPAARPPGYMSAVSARIRLFDGEVDLARREVVRGDARVALTPTEGALLAYLAARPGVAVPREELQVEVWGYRATIETRAVHHAVTRLRRKLEVDPDAPRHLVSVYGVGYRLEPAPPPPAEEDPVFVGRSADLARVAGWRGGGGRWLTIHGFGGMGKTTLARRAFAAEEDAAGWVSLAGLATVEAVAAAVVDALGGAVGPDLDASVVAALRARGGALVVLDDADRVAEALGPRLAGWLAAAPEARVVVTSRVALPGGDDVLALEPLAPDAGRALLRARAPGVPDDDALTGLVTALAGVPLAIVLAAPRLDLLGAAELTRRLTTPLAVLGSAEPGQASMRAVLEASWALLRPAEQRALAAVGVFGGPFDAADLEAVLGVSDALAELDALLRASWLHRVAGPRFDLYDVPRAFARERLAERDDAALLGHRHLLRRLDTARTTRRALDERWSSGLARRAVDDVADAIAAFDRELGRHPAEAAALLAEVGPTALRVVPGDARIDLALAAVASLPGAADLHARLSWLRGVALRTAGRLGEARVALERARTGAGDPELLGSVLGQLGTLANLEGRPADAEARYREAIDMLRAVGARSAVWVGNLGNVHLARGERAEAERLYLQALAELGADGHPGDRGRMHTNLGNLQLHRGALDAAGDSYALAERLLREADERVALAQLLGNRALVALERGELAAADRMAAEARAQHRRLGNRRSAAIAALTQAEIAVERGDVAAALELALAAEGELVAIGDRVFLPAARLLRGGAHHARGEVDAARAAYDAAIAGHEERGDAASACHARLWRAALQAEAGPPTIPEVPEDDAVGRTLRELVAGWGREIAPGAAASPHAEVRRMARLARSRATRAEPGRADSSQV